MELMIGASPAYASQQVAGRSFTPIFRTSSWNPRKWEVRTPCSSGHFPGYPHTIQPAQKRLTLTWFVLEIKRERKRQADRRHRKGRIVATFFQKKRMWQRNDPSRLNFHSKKRSSKWWTTWLRGCWEPGMGGASEPFLLVFACPSVWIQESHGALKLWLAISMVSCVILSIMAAEKYCHCAVLGWLESLIYLLLSFRSLWTLKTEGTTS